MSVHTSLPRVLGGEESNWLPFSRAETLPTPGWGSGPLLSHSCFWSSTPSAQRTQNLVLPLLAHVYPQDPLGGCPKGLPLLPLWAPYAPSTELPSMLTSLRSFWAFVTSLQGYPWGRRRSQAQRPGSQTHKNCARLSPFSPSDSESPKKSLSYQEWVHGFYSLAIITNTFL